MYLYYALRNLSNYLGQLRGVFYSLQSATRNVFLIGQYLSSWFGTIAAVCGSLEGAADDAATEWWQFYNWLTHNLGVSDALRDLMRYADDLISFIRYPFEFIADIIRDNLPALRDFQSDPVSYVLEILYRYTGLSYDFIHRPLDAISNAIDNALGDLRRIAGDPAGWLFDQIDNWIPDFRTLVYAPAEWVKRRIEERFPLLDDFLRDPDEFLQDRLVTFLDTIADRYRDRAIKLFEKVLDAIF